MISGGSEGRLVVVVRDRLQLKNVLIDIYVCVHV